jgi:hypothetical protein
VSNGETGGPTLREVILRDPLSDVTRKERSYLLGISIAGIVMVRTNLVPSRITALGITFEETDRKILIFLVGLVAAYFLAAFVLYAIADFLRRGAAVRAARVAIDREFRASQLADSPISDYWRSVDDRVDTRFYDRYIVVVRTFFEYILPVVLGVYAVWVLFSRALPL